MFEVLMEIRVNLLRIARRQAMVAGYASILTFCLLSIARAQQSDTGKSRVDKAQQTFTISSSDYGRYLSTVNLKNWDDGGDLSRFVYLHTSLVFPTASVKRGGRISVLHSEPERAISNYQVGLADGRAMSFDQFVQNVATIDGIVILHHGRIAYERYPHMDQTDKHLLFSTTKAFIGTLVGMLEADRLINVDRPIDAYIPELAGTAWAGTRVRDIADMASGIAAKDGDIEHPKSEHYRLEASLGWLELTPGLPEQVSAGRTYDYLMTLVRATPTGKDYVYSSANTLVLAWLVEKITGRAIYDVLSERIWSKLGAESDAQFVTNRLGIGVSHAGLTATLRDLARFGLLFTPSRKVVAQQQIIPTSLLHAIERGREDLAGTQNFLQLIGAVKVSAYQWGAITKDGAFMKGGYGGQMLYISPRKDLVVAYVGSEEFRDTDPQFQAVVRQLLQATYYSTVKKSRGSDLK
jgi:CubicO group peptidase (beta-lactamase class C family)